jgi:hypothetical protein
MKPLQKKAVVVGALDRSLTALRCGFDDQFMMITRT